jgi:hypothetical protein
MKRRLFSILVIFTLVIGLVPASVLAAPSAAVLQPGETVTFDQTTPINIIFIGYKRDAIEREALRHQLPRTYQPIDRSALFYGLPGRDLGLRFNFDYKITFTENNFANQFFDYLKQIGTPGDPTAVQLLYNDQKKNVLDVTGPVLYIDGPSVEAWLASNLNVDPKSYTIVFINWYSRPDFQFHVYTKTSEPDPDTGYNFGEIRPTRKLMAWGGTNSRLWFYDLSAGPEDWSGSWNVDDEDLDGDGIPDYRLPPIWEYSRKGYRKPAALSRDLGLVTRFVGINLLFTTSPLYDPLVPAPGVGGDRIVHITMFEDDRKSLGTDWIDTDFIHSQLAALAPYYNWQVHLVDRNPIDEKARRAFLIYAGLRNRDDCWNDFGTTEAELFCFFNLNYDKYVPAYRDVDYVVPVFALNTTTVRHDAIGFLGWADDNWTDGTQRFIYQIDSEGARADGYGFSTTTVHEVGHHIGLSHPHDGYDSELGIDYDSTGEFFFVWSGDESNTVMSYIDLNDVFSQFDKDNVHRWEFAGYLNEANNLLDDILAHPDANNVQAHITQAEVYAMQAIESFNNWDYLAAATNARLAFEQIAQAAEVLGIAPSINDELLLMAPQYQNVPHEVDPIHPD